MNEHYQLSWQNRGGGYIWYYAVLFDLLIAFPYNNSKKIISYLFVMYEAAPAIILRIKNTVTPPTKNISLKKKIIKNSAITPIILSEKRCTHYVE